MLVNDGTPSCTIRSIESYVNYSRLHTKLLDYIKGPQKEQSSPAMRGIEGSQLLIPHKPGFQSFQLITRPYAMRIGLETGGVIHAPDEGVEHGGELESARERRRGETGMVHARWSMGKRPLPLHPSLTPSRSRSLASTLPPFLPSALNEDDEEEEAVPSCGDLIPASDPGEALLISRFPKHG